jgi:hypothetical protein
LEPGDVRFIANAPTDIASLLAALDEATRRAEQLEAAGQGLRTDVHEEALGAAQRAERERIIAWLRQSGAGWWHYSTTCANVIADKLERGDDAL